MNTPLSILRFVVNVERLDSLVMAGIHVFATITADLCSEGSWACHSGFLACLLACLLALKPP